MIDATKEPVICTGWKSTKQEGVLSVQFRQECLRPVNSNNAMRKLFMQGHPAFGPCVDTRNAWVIMTKKALQSFGLLLNAPFPVIWDPRIIAVEFCDGDPIPEPIKDLYDGQDVFFHKTWSSGAQQPKTMPDGRVLTHKGAPIYRDHHLLIGDIEKKDFLKAPDGA